MPSIVPIDSYRKNGNLNIDYANAYLRQVTHSNKNAVTYNTYDNTKKLSQVLVTYAAAMQGSMLLDSSNQTLKNGSTFDGEILSDTSYKISNSSFTYKMNIWEIYE